MTMLNETFIGPICVYKSSAGFNFSKVTYTGSLIEKVNNCASRSRSESKVANMQVFSTGRISSKNEKYLF